MNIHTVFIAGAGLMGQGIARVSLDAGKKVILFDHNESNLRKAFENLASPDLTTTSDVHDVLYADLIIEAVSENPEIKAKLLRQLCKYAHIDAVIATNTSSLSIDALAEHMIARGRFVGLHFFNPVPRMALVEVIVGSKTSSDSVETALGFVKDIGKTAVIAKDSPGFIVNRVLFSSLMTALNILEEGVATIEDIDSAMKLGAGHPMGPFKLLDFIGLDTSLSIFRSLEKAYPTSFRVPSTLEKLVADGNLGRKSGKGFYDYTK